MLTLGAAHKGIEQAASVVRAVLGALSATTVLSVGVTKGGSGLVLSVVMAAIIGVATVLLGLFGRHLSGGVGEGNDRSSWLLQALDAVAFVGLVYALDGVASDAAWALLVVPIVLAALRLNDVAVLGTWLVASAGYFLNVLVNPQLAGVDMQTVVGRLAILLAVAASIALLTRWLQEGWRNQALLTNEAEQRTLRLAAVETAARSMRDVEPDQIIDVCLSHVQRLGFDAATAAKDLAVVGAAGAVEIVPSDSTCEQPEPGCIDVTRWQGPDGRFLHSVSVLEPISGAVVSGWVRSEIDDSMAHALADLVANAASTLEAARHLARARFEASHDPLTRLANRAEMHRNLKRAAASAEPTGVIFIDLDHFKEVNDTHGHLIGDRLLIALARRLIHAAPDELAARFGGDEFVVVVAGDRAAEAPAIGEQIRRSLTHPFRIDQLELTVTASVGIAIADGPTDPQRLLQLADQAAYAAKDAGRNKAYIANPTRMPALQTSSPAVGQSDHGPIRP